MKQKKQNKYVYGWNLWTNYGYGWIIESTYTRPEDTKSDVIHDANEYILAGARVKVTATRMLNPKFKVV